MFYFCFPPAQIRNDRLAENKLALQAYAYRGGAWAEAPSPATEASAFVGVLRAVRVGAEMRLVDIEAHLNDVAADWTNEAFNQELKQCLEQEQ